jgi:cobyrinic acid a,c-diamide synthase
MKAIVIGGTKSGVGKTTVALCIASTLKKRKLKVRPFKVGPDFIDPTHYSFCDYAVNLDVFMMGEEGVLRSFTRWMNGKDFGIVEGVMGLFDGYRFTEHSSTAHIAKLLGIPVILVIDAGGMSLSALAVFEGYRSFDREVNIVGVIFNGCSERLYGKLRRIFVERGYRVFGYLPKDDKLKIESRHLGLILGNEAKKDWKVFAEFGERYLDIDGIMDASVGVSSVDEYSSVNDFTAKSRTTIGVPFDHAFAFYYRDNLEILRSFADVIFFSPLKGEWVECDAYYLGGGYPELYPELKDFGKFIRKEAEDSKRIYAECGGMMFLSRCIDVDGKKLKMAGVLDIDIIFTKKLQALGYVKGEVIRDNPFFVGSFRGHEFHYSYALPDEDVRFAFKTDGNGIKDGLDGALVYNTLAGYTHIHFFSTMLSFS